MTSVYLPFIMVTLHAFFWAREISLFSSTSASSSNGDGSNNCMGSNSSSTKESTQRYSLWLLEAGTAASALFMAIGVCEGSTQLLKLWIQRRRPSFYDLCGFNKETLACTASLENIREANFSFPSGHSSLSSCGMTFLVWYFLGKLQQCGRTGAITTARDRIHRLKQWLLLLTQSRRQQRWMGFAIPILAWGWSIFVAASRLVDKWHHPSDVVAGLLLGFATTTLVYHTWYPPVWSVHAGIPRVLFENLDPAGAHSGHMYKLPTFSE